jgi:peptidyl-prolyl cis-trans isomerase SurA
LRASIKHLASPLALALIAGMAHAERESVDRVAAVIEDQIITMRELEEKAAPYLGQIDAIKDPAKREERRRQIYLQVLDIEIGERMVARELESNRERLGVTEQDIDRAIDEVLRLNRITKDQLQGALYGQGLTWSEYRKRLRDQIERARLIQFRVQGKVTVKDADATRRCEERQQKSGSESQVCASHILIGIPEGATKEQIEKLRTQASQLQAEVASGGDFAAYALKYSSDKAAPDGSLGCFGKGEMVPQFEEVAFKLKVGEISSVVKTRFGFHIIKVTGRQAAATANCTDEESLNQFKNELYQEEMERQMTSWIAELRSKAFVEVRL